VIDSTALLLFLSANFVVLVIPGPAVIYTISRSLDQGTKAGLLSVYGLAVGTFPHALAVALGVAGLLASSVIAFTVMKYLGAAYLVFLGIGRMRQGQSLQKRPGIAAKTGRAAFIESFAVGVTNPKSVMFFLAFLPQFVDPARGNLIAQTMILWFLSQVMAVAVGSAYALTAGGLRSWLSPNRAIGRLGGILSGSVYIGLGLVTALSGSKTK
jgi:threonine/homoserine/homoserine lactone efflux protein